MTGTMESGTPGDRLGQALADAIERVAVTGAAVGSRFPLYAEPGDGRWTTTGRGSWTGGFWAGLLWLRRGTPEPRPTGGPPPRARPASNRGWAPTPRPAD
ncbi:hypothetical protein WKI68_07435 [Streptomyces sp. MS1.HAVA.3]|uniref:Uncharacterized protein n=1 Tax=Streptomyces caledonius TaxID=3134107 RepID=A0ABU8U1Y9_9ACTN